MCECVFVAGTGVGAHAVTEEENSECFFLVFKSYDDAGRGWGG